MGLSFLGRYEKVCGAMEKKLSSNALVRMNGGYDGMKFVPFSPVKNFFHCLRLENLSFSCNFVVYTRIIRRILMRRARVILWGIIALFAAAYISLLYDKRRSKGKWLLFE
ncbi:MAG: hypothetical protein LBF67_04135 [Prevotellaceae bacterium]|nr:hypothetical protein [Prevotellaceae bacterium]